MIKSLILTTIIYLICNLAIAQPNVQSNHTSLDIIKTIFENYIQYEESTDSRNNQEQMIKSLQSLKKGLSKEDFQILINVWMYYDPTDFDGHPILFKILKENRPASIEAVEFRIKNKMTWESDETAPYADLPDLLLRLKTEP